MAILTDDTGKDYAGSGTTGVAWAGLGLSVLNTLMGGALGGGLLGGVRPGQQGPANGTLVADAAVSKVAEKDAEIANLKAQLFTNQTVQSFYDRHAQETADAIAQQAKVTEATIKPIADDVRILREANVEHAAKLACIEQKAALEKENADLRAKLMIEEATAPLKAADQGLLGAIDLLRQKVASDINAEAAARICADNNLSNYVNTVFMPKRIAGVTTDATSTPQVTFNPNGCPGCTGGRQILVQQTATAAG